MIYYDRGIIVRYKAYFSTSLHEQRKICLIEDIGKIQRLVGYVPRKGCEGKWFDELYSCSVQELEAIAHDLRERVKVTA